MSRIIDLPEMERRGNLARNAIRYVLTGMGHAPDFPTRFSVDPITYDESDVVTPACFDLNREPPTIMVALGDVAFSLLWGNLCPAPDISAVYAGAHEATHAGQWLVGRLHPGEGGLIATARNPAEHYKKPLEKEALAWSIRAVRFLLDLPDFEVTP